MYGIRCEGNKEEIRPGKIYRKTNNLEETIFYRYAFFVKIYPQSRTSTHAHTHTHKTRVLVSPRYKHTSDVARV